MREGQDRRVLSPASQHALTKPHPALPALPAARQPGITIALSPAPARAPGTSTSTSTNSHLTTLGAVLEHAIEEEVEPAAARERETAALAPGPGAGGGAGAPCCRLEDALVD